MRKKKARGNMWILLEKSSEVKRQKLFSELPHNCNLWDSKMNNIFKRKENDKEKNNKSYLLRSCFDSDPTQDINIEGAKPFWDNQRWGQHTSAKRTKGWLGTKF